MPDDNEGEPIRPTSGLTRATAIYARAVTNPLEVAAENAQLRSTVKGAHLLLRALTKRAGGTLTIPTEEHQAVDPAETLEVIRDDDDNVTLMLRKMNRAERRARG